MSVSCNTGSSRRDFGAWYVAVTQPRRESMAIENLRRQNFPTFFPRVPQGAARSRSVALAPLFPGYVFVSFCRETHRWQSINGTVGVRTLLGRESRGPARVPRATMDALFSRCPQGVWDSAVGTLQRGDPVKVVSGPLAGASARFDEFLPRERVRILLQCLGGEVEASCSVASIEEML
ncbi:transcription termination/antitermination protein NusG [Novosphingobium sp.]|uniref:transcription termination/antitermination protein NusG n=1 Tax=Novosphingobium sp. TaxID=1874826 RepID=UPI0038BDA7FF